MFANQAIFIKCIYFLKIIKMEKLMFLSRESLLQKDVLKKEKVELTKGYVFVREMTASEKNDFEMSMLKQIRTGNPKNPVSYETTLENYRTKLVVCTLCDEEGNLLFTKKDIQLLSQNMSASNMEKIADKASELNAITKEDREELLKNSETDLEEDSNSSSVEN